MLFADGVRLLVCLCDGVSFVDVDHALLMCVVCCTVFVDCCLL